MSDTPESLIEAVRYYADKQVCFETMLRVKWPDGKPVCPACGHGESFIIRTRQKLQCKACKRQYSVKVDTIFEDSPLGLDKWFVAVWCIANAKNGISSCELGRALGVTQKTAWFMLHRIRLAMKTKTFLKLDGEVESDETHIGGKHGNMHAGRRAKAKAKSIAQALLERGHYGIFHQLSKRHLPRYTDEFAFRWNGRKLTDGERMVKAIVGAEGKRLKYKQPME